MEWSGVEKDALTVAPCPGWLWLPADWFAMVREEPFVRFFSFRSMAKVRRLAGYQVDGWFLFVRPLLAC